MRKPCITDRTVKIDGMTWGERELSQIIRRKMITREVRNKKKYTRKIKHNNERSINES